jgi:hypothetical protein
MSAAAPPGSGACRNCGAPLGGRYCAVCGQAADVHVPSTRELLHEALEGITHSDSRLWLTLKLLWFKPGMLTREFIAGRRVAYLPPFRLYLVLSLLFFLVESLSASRNHFVVFDPTNGKMDAESACTVEHITAFGRDWGPRLKHVCLEASRDQGRTLGHVAVAQMPKAMFVFLPLVAFLHMLMYWRPRHRYAEHLLFFLHLHAYFFSIMTLVAIAAAAGEAWPPAAAALDWVPLILWALPVYTLLAMRRVFNRGWTATVARGVALSAVYLVVMSVTVAGVFVYAALQL